MKTEVSPHNPGANLSTNVSVRAEYLWLSCSCDVSWGSRTFKPKLDPQNLLVYVLIWPN